MYEKTEASIKTYIRVVYIYIAEYYILSYVCIIGR